MQYDNALVTGGAGFIGSHTVDALLASGVETWVLDDLSSGSLRNLLLYRHNRQLHFVRGSISNYKKVRTLSRKVDGIIHLAAQISPFVSMKYPETTNSTNVDGTLNVLRAAVKEKIQKVVFASSSSVYGDAKSRYVSEELPTNPITPYGASKLAAEKYCGAFYRAYGIPTISLRYFNVYGQRQSSNPYSGVIAIFTRALVDHRRPIIYGDGYQTRDFVHVSDVAKANVKALENETGYGEAFNVGTGKATTVKHLFELLRQVTRRPEIQPILRKQRAGDIRDSCADMMRTRSRLRFAPNVDLKTGLTQLIESLGS
ncbi:MAG: NAD-dependent epimerase/dehydratase family protein [Candidatus Bathyarchaeia archaeon]